ncbi:MAG: aldehyde dehydrogenase (NADP(+)), partial [Pyrinomonadaceae bacterium]
LQQSVTLGVGQFCTCPGMVVGLAGASLDDFIVRMKELTAAAAPATMLHPGILRSYEEGLERLASIEGIETQRSRMAAEATRTQATPAVFVASVNNLLANKEISEEVFGPSTVIVKCRLREEMLQVARGLEGHLTATIHGTAEELGEYQDLIDLLQTKVGRLVFNGFPTGVEVCAAMQHGGPYPATTDARSTSVGTAAIKRFARPICFQNFPQDALPPELQDRNPRGVWRVVDNQVTRE